MSEITPEPGERRPLLDRAPGERYAAADRAPREPSPFERLRPALAIAVVGVGLFVLLGGPFSVTAGLVILGGFIGLLIGLTLGPPSRAAALAAAAVGVGLLGIWLYARSEGGVLGPFEYFAEVQGVLVPVEFLAAVGMAAAASR